MINERDIIPSGITIVNTISIVWLRAWYNSEWHNYVNLHGVFFVLILKVVLKYIKYIGLVIVFINA